MHKHPGLRKTAALTISAALLLGTIPASAIDDGVKPTYDEAYYATTDYYGNLTEGSVVKSYRTNGVATLTDYGQYDEINNLTDGTAPTVSGGRTVFRFDEDNVPKTFYFEGKTTKPFTALPWTLAVHYSLNGVPARAEELAGKEGVVEITLDAVPNASASEYARNNYTLEAMAIFNQDDILSLEAPGAQVQLIGNLRAVLFIGLPGEECHYTIRVGSEDFSFGGMTFLMVPATLSQLEEIAKLSERKDDLEDNYEKLSGSMDSLLDAMAAMTGSLNASADGLDRLDQARGIFSDGKGSIYAGTDALRGDLSNLAEVLEPVQGQITALSQAITDSKATLNSMTDTLGDLKDDLRDAERALSALEDGTGDVKKVLSSLGSLKKSLKALQTALGGQVSDAAEDINDAIDKNQNIGSLTVSQVKEAHSAYTAGREEYYVIALKQQGYSTSQAAATAAAAVDALNTNGNGSLAELEMAKAQLESTLSTTEERLASAKQDLQSLKDMGLGDSEDAKALETVIGEAEAGIARLESNIAQLEGAIALETAYQAKEGMTFQTFCQKVLEQPAATAKQMNDLWLVYASGKVEYEDEEKGNTPEDGGTLSGTLLHNDPAPEDSSDSGNSGSSGSDSGSDSGSSSESTGGTTSSSGNGESTGGTTGGSGETGSTGSGTGETGSTGSGTGETGNTGSETGNTGSETGGTDTGETPVTPETPTNPETPENPENPETPTDPEAPLDPSESVGGAMVDLIAGGLDSAMAEISSLRNALYSAMNRLKNPTSQVVSDLSALCGRIEDLAGLLDDAADLSTAVRHASSDLRSIISDVEDLQDTLNDYEPILQETLQTVSDLSVSAVQTIRDTESLVTDTEALMKSTGSALDDGTKQTLQGLAEVLRRTAQTMGTAGEIKTAKNSICGIIEDTWNEYTGEANNLLLMDATAEAVSLTDSRNDAPESIQVLIRTQEITKAEAEKAELTGKTAEKTTFWQRVAQMFRDFWSAVTGIFKGKD